jgi:hypothetical protein
MSGCATRQPQALPLNHGHLIAFEIGDILPVWEIAWGPYVVAIRIGNDGYGRFLVDNQFARSLRPMRLRSSRTNISDPISRSYRRDLPS